MEISTINFSKTTKLNEPAGQEQFLVSKMNECLLHQIAREIVSLLVNNVHKKNIAESQDRRNFESVRALFVICSLVTALQSCCM